MSGVDTPRRRLGDHLERLRLTWEGVQVTQEHVAQALGVGPHVVDAWETGRVTPPEDRLRGYARFFASHRSMAAGVATLLPADELTQPEERRRQELVDELVRLREEAMQRPSGRERTGGALGGRFWHYPNGQRITILCTPASDHHLGLDGRGDLESGAPPLLSYATNRRHPNVVRELRNLDIDSLLELVGHVRAENPTLEVRWLTRDRITSVDELTGHVVVLGRGGDLRGDGWTNDPVGFFMRGLGLPVSARRVPDGDPEFDLEFAVSVDGEGLPSIDGAHEVTFRSRYLRDELSAQRPKLLVKGAPQMEHDVALIVRRRNPLNPAAEVTVCSGLFTRGTYGAVRAFTDATFRARNERYLSEHFDPDDFWMLVQVPIFAGDRTVTPDLAQARQRLHTSIAPEPGYEE